MEDMRDDYSTSPTIERGRHLFTKDGTDLGVVDYVEGSFIRVDAPLQRDYWLSSTDVATDTDEGLIVDFESALLDSHKLREPGYDPANDPMRETTMSPVFTEAEQLEQRARMERELAEQSKKLGEHEESVTEMRENRENETIPVDHAGFESLRGEPVPYAPALGMGETEDRSPGGTQEGARADQRFEASGQPSLIDESKMPANPLQASSSIDDPTAELQNPYEPVREWGAEQAAAAAGVVGYEEYAWEQPYEDGMDRREGVMGFVLSPFVLGIAALAAIVLPIFVMRRRHAHH